MPPLFFQEYWNVVGPKVSTAVLNILNGGQDPTKINSTIIALIPKVKNPTTCAEYRPISLCNVVMKVATKTIANRLKPHMNDIVHENQGAFIPGRLITDVALIGFEAFHYLKRKSKGKMGYCALKLDMQKAYDRIEWEFLERMMRALGFGYGIVELIMRCVRTVTYSVQVNGLIGESFKPTRSLRQGDPLSPYLFLFAAEGFGALLRQAHSQGLLHGIRLARTVPALTHLFFADDALLFSRATETEFRRILQVLDVYEKASGQRVNLGKSAVTFSQNLTTADTERLRGILGVRTGGDAEVYLGLPSVIGRSKKQIFQHLEQRIQDKIETWKVRTLSRAGREVMIKSVLQSIPTYVMSYFELPSGTCERIENLLCNFYWGGAPGERKIYWRSWARLCQSKREGGLGFHRLQNFNRAMLAKQGWRLLTNPNTFMSSILRGIYFPRIPLLEVELKPGASFTWHSLMSGLSLLKRGLEWRIGSGERVRFWDDVWLPNLVHGHPTYRFPGTDLFRSVADFIQEDSKNWDENLIRNCVMEEDVSRILSIRLSSRRLDDVIRWRHTIDGEYTVKSGYHVDFNAWWSESPLTAIPNIDTTLLQKCWNLKCPPRMKTFLWRVIDNNLPVRANLAQRGMEVENVCPMCDTKAETILHLFFICPNTQRLWLDMGVDLQPSIHMSVFEALSSLLSISEPRECGQRAASLWSIWKIRNLKVFKPAEEVIFMIELEKGLRFLKEYLEMLEKPVGVRPERNTRWRPPEAGWIKVNVDAGVCANGGGQIGVVIRGEHGQFIAAVSRIFRHIHHPTLLEGQAILAGLEFATSLGLDGIVIKSDCQVVINQLVKGGSNRSDLGMILDDCRVASLAFSQLRYMYTNREANEVAHVLAKLPPQPGMDVQVFTWPPAFLNDLLDRDIAAAFGE